MEFGDKYIGRILDNRYEIIELIGAGGMAYVYKARCHRLNRLVAIKILKEELSGDEEFQRRFYTESQAVAMLSHPNIVAVYDVSRSGSTEYIVMELIEGITLKQYINRKGLLNWKEALHFASQITKALTHAHSRGLIHRDIKPHNIMILKDGSVKVADFGIARLLSVQNTLTQETLGSVHYISPEQAKGGQVDARSDIYSVGVVMYEMLTSRLPFVGDTPVSVAIQHISAIPLRPRDINPDIPAGLEEITMHAMEPDVMLRFASADEMLSDLEDFRRNPGIVFNYAMSNPAERQSADIGSPYETRYIPKDAINASDVRTSRSMQPAISTRPRNDLSPEEYRDAKRRSGSTATLVGIFAVVIFVVVLLAIFVFPSINEWLNPADEQTTIPDFVGRRFDDIRLSDDYFDLYVFDPIFEPNNDVAEGVVISQDPAAARVRAYPRPGERIRVRLWISSGDEPPAEMPDLRGLHYVEARNRLINMQLSLQIESEPVAGEEPRGTVIETLPRAGDALARGNQIIIRYSLGPEDITVVIPDMVGSTEAAVNAAFAELDLVMEVSRFESADPEGTVTFIAHVGATVSRGTRVAVHVSTGPPATPEPTPTPEPEPTPTPTPTPPDPTPTPPPEPPPDPPVDPGEPGEP
ncbi:MAG: Stk1 family PASTA domain-containing Ser/Thr kinase [Oscillospiraceae bacterium]|nr:Stk1 family PASTA domain-containing Ser/Thr kinase [Oscillospiraceae bacterium]MCL2278317.1 Stk1 family PASTA domain-containing Ser/Thr kinase [Oscillospiraceae bacterium]